MATDQTQQPGAESLPGEVVEDILASDRRRALLEVLADAGGPVPVPRLASAVQTAESEETADASRNSRRAVEAEIYDRHLPKLLATGVVEYDSMRDAVELTDCAVTAEV